MQQQHDRIMSATGDKKKQMQQQRLHGDTHEPTVPWSRDSAGGDITSSLIDTSMAYGKGGEAHALHQTGSVQGGKRNLTIPNQKRYWTKKASAEKRGDNDL